MGKTKKEELLDQLRQAVENAATESSTFIPEVVTTLTDSISYLPVEVRPLPPKRRQQLRDIQEQVNAKLDAERQEPSFPQQIIDSIRGRKSS